VIWENDLPVDFVIDTQRTCLQERFFSNFAFDNMSDLIGAVSEMRVGLDSMARNQDLQFHVYSGWVYWFLYLRGFLEFKETKHLAAHNIYLRYMLRYYAPRRHDPGLEYMVGNPIAARDRVMARFRHSLMFSTYENGGNDAPPGIEPVIVTVTDPAPLHPLQVFPMGATDSVGGSLVDGWHRLFGARIFGVTSLPGQVVRDQRPAIELSS
jgi:hypothetical protein